MSILSQNVLAKDIIGQAQEMAAVEDARLLIKELGITYYNSSITELYNMLSYLDSETFVVSEIGLALTGALPKQVLEFSALTYPIDKLEATSIQIDTEIYQAFGIRAAEFARHETFKVAQHPYESSFCFTEKDQGITLLGGVDVPTTGTATGLVDYKRQPTILTKANYDTAKMDLADKYLSVLIARIAAFAEIRSGITDRSMAAVKMSYQGILQQADAEYKNSVIQSLNYGGSYAPEENPVQKGMGIR